jgi:hypothetical protein
MGEPVCQFGGTYPYCWDEPNPPPPEPDPGTCTSYSTYGCGGGDGGGGGGGTGDGGPAPSDCTVATGCDPESYCDPTRDPDCEKELTDADTAAITRALRDMVLPQNEFTDSAVARRCGEMVQSFNTALTRGEVFRGKYDSDPTVDSVPRHHGAYIGGHIHFDPGWLDRAARGEAAALREIAITAFHEGAHWAGSKHPAGATVDAQGRDYYTDPPFNLLNPGPNSCIPR